MKRNITTLCLLISTTSVLAQLPSISSTNQIPAIEDTIHYTDANPFGFDPDGSGGVVNVMWDFQALIPTTTIDFWYEDPTSTPEAANFPTASVAMANSLQAGYEYFETTSNSIARLGYTGSSSIYYNQGWNRYEFPIDPGVTWNTTNYTGTMSSLGAGEDSVTITNGNFISNPDAYGVVKLPPSVFGGSPEIFEDVVRVHVTESFQIIAWLFGTPAMTINITDDYYFWFDEETQEPILINGVTTDDAGGSPQTVLRYQSIPGTGSDVSINEETDYSVSVTPNPSNGNLVIQSEILTNDSYIKVVNAIGEMVYSAEIRNGVNSHNIDLGNISKGIYLVTIGNQESLHTKRIVIE